MLTQAEREAEVARVALTLKRELKGSRAALRRALVRVSQAEQALDRLYPDARLEEEPQHDRTRHVA